MIIQSHRNKPNTCVDQWNRIVDPDINSCSYSHLIFFLTEMQKKKKPHTMEKIQHLQKMKLNIYTLYKNQFKNLRPSGGPGTLKLQRENTARCRYRQKHFERVPIALELKPRIYWDCMKLKRFFHNKEKSYQSNKTTCRMGEKTVR